MSVEVSKEVDFMSKTSGHGSYKYVNVNPLNVGGAPLPMNPNSITEVQIETPIKVFNMARSNLEWQLDIPEPAASGSCTYLHTLGNVSIDRVTLLDQGGVELANLTYHQLFSRAMAPYLTSQDDYDTNDNATGASTSSVVQDTGFNNFRSNTIANLGSVANAESTGAVRFDTQSARLTQTGTATAPDPTAFPAKSYQEQCYFIHGNTRNGSGQGNVVMNYSLPLRQFYHTLMSMDRDFYSPNALILRVHFSGLDRVGWVGLSSTDATQVGLIQSGTISNIRLRMAVEQNPVIRDSIIAKVASEGTSMVVPFVWSNVLNTGPSDQVAIQHRYNSSYGQRLLSVYSACYGSTSTGLHAYDLSNVNHVAQDGPLPKVQNFQTQINSENLQEYVLNNRKNDAYNILKPLLKGSTIESSNQYLHNQVWIDSFRSGRCAEWLDTDGVKDGKFLDEELIHTKDNQVQYNPPNGTGISDADKTFRQYTFAVTQRTLTIDPSGLISMR